MSKVKSEKSNTQKKSNDQELTICKYCGERFPERNIQVMPKKKLDERMGIWGGIEYPFIQIYKVVCGNASCGKKYSIKTRGSDWLYK